MAKFTASGFNLAQALVSLPLLDRTHIFWSAVDQENIDAIKLICSSGIVDADSATHALFHAATNNQIELATEALKIPGVDINWRSEENYDYTPLRTAAKNNNAGVMELLIARDDLASEDLNSSEIYEFLNRCFSTIANVAYRNVAIKIEEDPRFNRDNFQAFLKAKAEGTHWGPAESDTRADDLLREAAREERLNPIRLALGLRKWDL